jgi:hypothetical protein
MNWQSICASYCISPLTHDPLADNDLVKSKAYFLLSMSP